jgi:hypothetical protein
MLGGPEICRGAMLGLVGSLEDVERWRHQRKDLFAGRVVCRLGRRRPQVKLSVYPFDGPMPARLKLGISIDQFMPLVPRAEEHYRLIRAVPPQHRGVDELHLLRFAPLARIGHSLEERMLVGSLGEHDDQHASFGARLVERLLRERGDLIAMLGR